MNPLDRPLATAYAGESDRVLQCFISYNKDGGYCVPQSSRLRPVSQRIMSGKVWEPDTLEFIAKHAGTGDIVHAGAYFGDFIPALSRACVPGAKLWAFEPNPENYRCAVITTAVNGLTNVELKNAGLGAEPGLLPMLIVDENGTAKGGGSQLEVDGDRNNSKQYVEVEVIRLDDLLPPGRHVTILQLDVEEFEQQALTGAMATIRRDRPIVIVEKLPDPDWLSGNLWSLGYRESGKLHQNTILSVQGAI